MDESAYERILSEGAVGCARTATSGWFFVNFESIPSRYESFVEVGFNPEYVVLEGHETDVYLTWGTRAEVIEDLRKFFVDLEVRLCPRDVEDVARSHLFGAQRQEASFENGEVSWEEFRA